MSGFLARLAARAGGDRSTVVRPRHRSLFEPDAVPFAEHAAPFATSLPRPLRPEPTVQASRARPATPPAHAAAPTMRADEPPGVPAPEIPDAPAAERSHVTEERTPPVPAARRLGLSEPSKRAGEAPPDRPANHPAPATTTGEPAPAAFEPPAEPNAPRVHHEREPLSTPLRKPRPARTTGIRQSSSPRRSALRLDADRNQDPAIVHVTIDRVEVRAAPEERTGEGAESRKQPAVTTLDAYLKQRAEARR
jgi:hypothetical protein